MECAVANHPGRRLFRGTDDVGKQIFSLLMDQGDDVGAVVDDDLRSVVERRANVPVVRIVVFAFDGIDRDPLLDERRRDFILSRQRVACAENGIRAARLQGKRQVRCFRRDMRANHDANAVERAFATELIPDLSQHRHFAGCPIDSAPPFGGETRILDIERACVG
jgi:hypothetical protein